jgi:hypothetical protein
MAQADSNDTTNNVVKFPYSVSRRAHARKPRASADAPTPARSLSATGENYRLRKERGEAWNEARTIREYWKARLEMEFVVSLAQGYGLPEGNNHPPHNPDERLVLLVHWRQAIVQQLLTPAPDAGAVAWKKAAFAGGKHKYTDVKAERIELSISNDEAFLAAHPIRQSSREKAVRS